MTSESEKRIYELIMMNRQGGYTYTVKMKDIPKAFEGIPVASGTDPDRFVMEVFNTGPESNETRMVEGNISDIEYMTKC